MHGAGGLLVTDILQFLSGISGDLSRGALIHCKAFFNQAESRSLSAVLDGGCAAGPGEAVSARMRSEGRQSGEPASNEPVRLAVVAIPRGADKSTVFGIDERSRRLGTAPPSPVFHAPAEDRGNGAASVSRQPVPARSDHASKRMARVAGGGCGGPQKI